MSSFSAAAVFPRRDQLGSWLHSWVHGGSLPGASVMLYHRDTEVGYFQSGFANVATSSPITRDTIFRIYSMTKPVTVVAALILIERGLLSIEDPVEKYIPSFANMQVYVSGDGETLVTEPASKSITVKELMTHTAGITYGIFGQHPCDKILVSHLKSDAPVWFKNTPLSELCDAISKTPLCFQPGKHWHYGFNTDVLGYIIELISGQSLDVFMHNEIFSPLGMADTGFFVPVDKLSRLAECYDLKGPNHPYARSTSAERERTEIPALHSGGGGLVSTIDDYMAFARCLYRKGELNGVRILSVQSVELMYQNHLPGGKEVLEMSFSEGFSETFGGGIGFGLGVSVVTDPSRGKGTALSGVGEYGWGGAASTWVQIDPVHDNVVVFMTQAIPSALLPMRSHLRWLCHWITGDVDETGLAYRS